MRSYTNLRGAFRATGASLPFLSRRAHLLTTDEIGGGTSLRKSCAPLAEGKQTILKRIVCIGRHICNFADKLK